MKKLLVIAALVLASQMNFGQNVFDKFENKKDVTSMIVTKNMFKLMSKIDLSSNDPEAQQYLKMVENLNDIKIFTTDNAQVAQEMKLVVDTYLKASPKLTELMRVNDDGKNIRFYSREGKNENIVSELLMFLEDTSSQNKQAVVMTITGSLDLKQLSQLTADLKVPGSDKLKNVEKKKGNK